MRDLALGLWQAATFEWLYAVNPAIEPRHVEALRPGWWYR